MTRMALLDLPVPMEPVFVDLDLPLEEQLFGNYLTAARELLKRTEGATQTVIEKKG